MSTIYSELDQALNNLRQNANELSNTMQDVRRWMANEEPMSAILNERIANDILRKAGYSDEPTSKLKQWGVHDAASPEAVEKIIAEVIEYRKDKGAGRL